MSSIISRIAGEIIKESSLRKLRTFLKNKKIIADDVKKIN